jgi:hypothetical protein
MPRRRLLVAAHPECLRAIRDALRGDFDLTVCTTLEAVKWRLAEHHDLILCGIYFDESRMFDLLRYAGMETSQRPVVCINSIGPPLNAMVYQAVEIATRALGAHAFVDLERCIVRLGAPPARSTIFTPSSTMPSRKAKRPEACRAERL